MLLWSPKAVICNLDLHFVPVADKPEGPVLEICVARKTGKQTHRLVAPLDGPCSSCHFVDEGSVSNMASALVDSRVTMASLAISITPLGVPMATLVATGDIKPFRSEICVPVTMKKLPPVPVPVDDGEDLPPAPASPTEPGLSPGRPEEESREEASKRHLDEGHSPEPVTGGTPTDPMDPPAPPVKKPRRSKGGVSTGQSKEWSKEEICSMLASVPELTMDIGEDFGFMWTQGTVRMSMVKQRRRAVTETPIYICSGKLVDTGGSEGQSCEAMEWNPSLRTKVFWAGTEEDQAPCLWSVSGIIDTKAIAHIDGKGPLNIPEGEGAAKGQVIPRGKSSKCFMPDLEEEPHFPVFFYALQHGILNPDLFKTAFALWRQDADGFHDLNLNTSCL